MTIHELSSSKSYILTGRGLVSRQSTLSRSERRRSERLRRCARRFAGDELTPGVELLLAQAVLAGDLVLDLLRGAGDVDLHLKTAVLFVDETDLDRSLSR